MVGREAGEVLRKARQALDNAHLGLNDLTGDDPKRRIAGLHNVAVWGRAVTNVLQTLRGVDRARFDAWYEPRRAEMAADPLMRYFYTLRSEVLKQGGPVLGTSHHIAQLNTADLEPLMAHPPSGAESFFIGDDLGGSGWVVRAPDGTSEKHYVTLPSSVRVHSSFRLPDPPEEHLGQPLSDDSAESLARLYFRYVERLVAEAEVEFSN